MMWEYRTIVFEFAKDGLLGEKYIDDEAVEATLNEQGMKGWELVDVVTVHEGVLAVLKRERVGNGRDGSIEQAAEPVESVEPAPVEKEEQFSNEEEEITAEEIRRQELEHIRRLEENRRKAMEQHEHDHIGDIKIS